MLRTRTNLLAALAVCGWLSTAAYAVTYVKVADEWGTIQPAGPRTGQNGIRAWNIEGFGAGGATFSSSGTLRFYMADLVASLNTAFPGGWQVNNVTLVTEHNDAAFSAPGSVSIFHFTNDALAITSGQAAPVTDALPNDFTALGVSPLQYLDTATVGGQPVRVQLAGGVEPDMGTVTKVNDYTFSSIGNVADQNLDVLGTPGSLVDPAGAINATPDYTISLPTGNPDDTLATFTTELAADAGDWSAGGQSTIIADIQSGTDALSFIFAATDADSTVAATYQGNPFNQAVAPAGMLFQPRIYLDVTATTSANVAGDYNGNGIVDGADYVVWRNGGPLQNDANTPGVVDPTDYSYWRSRFGATSGGSGVNPDFGAAVPEPGSVLLLVVGLAALGLSRRAG